MFTYPVPRPTGGSPDMIDVSHWQGNIDWNRIAAQGVKNAIIKCTNGAHNTDNRYEQNVDACRALGIKVGSYHFMLSSQNPDEQAENFIANCSTLKSGDILPMLDVEWDMKGKRDQWLDVPLQSRVAMIGRFLIQVRHQLGAYPMIYSGSWWVSMIGNIAGYEGSQGKVTFGNCPFVVAAYTKQLKRSQIPAPWVSKGPSIWQYSGNGVLSGIRNQKSEVDFDKLLVPIESLLIS